MDQSSEANHEIQSDDPLHQAAGAIPTGSLRLDATLGIGGIPCGWMTEISGAEQAGKTTFCLHLAASAQRQGSLCAWVDADHSLDPAYAIRCGVDPDQFYLVEPTDAEQALSVVQSLVQSNCMALIVVDSAGALVTREELHTPLGQGGASGPNTLLSRSLPGLAAAARHNQTALVFTNRTWPGTPPVYHQLHSQPEKLALKLHAAIRLQAIRCQKINVSSSGGAVTLRLRCIKNKFSEDFRAIQLDIVYNEAQDHTGDIFDLSSAFLIIHQQGTRFYYQGHCLGESRAEVIEALLLDHHLAEEIENAVRRQIGMKNWQLK